ncbi:MAG: phage terminase large subunit, partial [Pseudomonadota bacterium]
MSDLQQQFDALLRTNFSSFVAKTFDEVSGGNRFAPNWHIDAIAWQLDRIRRGENTRLIVTMPPRYLKSIAISVAWPAWMLGHNPHLNFVCISYSADLAAKHANDCRSVMRTDWYQRLFPNTRLQKGSMAEMDFRTTGGGGRFSTSVGGTLTGRGGDIIIIDDPIKPDEANSPTTRKNVLNWYSNTLASRLNDKRTGSIVLVMQRLHEDDLAGHLIDAGGWHHLSLPAIAETDLEIPIGEDTIKRFTEGKVLHPEREALDQLEALRRSMGSATFAAQYQQDPVPLEGLHVKRDWLRYYQVRPEPIIGDQIVQSWDTASKDGVFSDYSVCITALIRKREIYVLDVQRAKLKFPDLKRRVEELARKWEAKVLLIEDAASGQQLIQVLRNEAPRGVPRPIARKPESDKETRFAAQSHRIEAGALLLPEDAPWLGELEHELLGFPGTIHDDQVDALTQLLAWEASRPLSSYAGTLDHPSLWPTLIEV